jgi:diguanylate cyclase (GGDEF)-like protein
MGHARALRATRDTTEHRVDPADARTWPSDPEAGRRILIALSAETEELRRQTLHDDLTGLANRVLLDDRLETALRSADRSGDPCSVLLMDLDGFKQINDTRGHAAGDVVLREVAARLTGALRAQDTVARIGGDEFAAVLPDTDTDGAVRAARRIIKELHVGASIGIAVFPHDGATAEELLAHADQAMYRAKEAGGGYLLFSPGADFVVHGAAKPRRKRFRRRGVVLGVALALAILAGAMTPNDSAARLHTAAAGLDAATFDEMDGAVADVERAVGEIAWKEVGFPQVAAALGRLEVALASLEVAEPTPLGERVHRLITTIRQAPEMAGHDELAPRPKPAASLPPVSKPA